jgi:hypothetical protein
MAKDRTINSRYDWLAKAFVDPNSWTDNWTVVGMDCT